MEGVIQANGKMLSKKEGGSEGREREKERKRERERGMEFHFITIQFPKLENPVLIGLWGERNPLAMLVRM